MAFTFPRTARLTRPGQFRDVLSNPEVNVGRGPLRMRARKNTLCRARLGLVVPKRGTPKAVRRNRIKRIARDRFRLCANQLPAIDIVVQVFQKPDHWDDQHLAAALDRLFQQLANEPGLAQN